MIRATLRSTIAIFIASLSTNIVAQQDLASDTLYIAEPDSVTFTDETMTEAVDSLITAWYSSRNVVANDLVPDSLMITDSIISGVPDSVYVERLSAMMSPIPMTYNAQVKKFIELYIVKRRDQVQKMLGLSKYYFPIFEEILDANDMPLELKFLPIIESALNPRALSRVGASGLWQFMYYTGKRYDLSVTSYVDERRDPVKASKAAALFLRELYNIYGDWHLAIAAYNCGPGNVNRAIARSGGQRDFWKIYYHLPRETRGYVPAFIAASYAMTYAAEHNLYPTQSILPVASDTVMIHKPLHFDQVANVLKLPMELIRDLNPQYRHDVVPATAPKTYPLALPVEVSFAFAAQEDTIYAFNRAKYFPDNKIVPVSEASYGHYTPANSAKLIYTVKEGDVPGGIASKFNVRLSDLKYWNGLRRNIIRIGQKLVIYVPKSKVSRYQHLAKVAK
jgi:membrane-bound lytic murein transglycosylase D